MLTYCEVEVANGLEALTKTELLARLGKEVLGEIALLDGALKFEYEGDLSALLRLKTINAAYLLHTYPVPRPKALLGHEHFHHLLRLIDHAMSVEGKEAFGSMYLSAAGSDSSVMTRLKDELSQNIGLPVADDAGDLLIRVRRSSEGWDVLVRLSARPNATRDWRVCNMEGALNAPVAHAMIASTQPLANDVCLNLMCGSGSLMIERALHSSAAQIIGCDIDRLALNCALRNIHAANCAENIQLFHADVTQLPFPEGYFDKLYADLPFGQLMGSHRENVRLYPAVLQEAARVAKPRAILALITHEVRLMENLLRHNDMWQVQQIIKVSLRGLHPQIFLLRKTG